MDEGLIGSRLNKQQVAAVFSELPGSDQKSSSTNGRDIHDRIAEPEVVAIEDW